MNKEQIGLSFKIAATYIGTVVGAGFATGKEIVQFFSINGLYGLIGIFFSGMLFIWIGTKMMVISIQINAQSAQDFNQFLFGKNTGNIVNCIMLIGLLAVTSVMISGAGATFEEQIGIPRQFGIIITIIITLLILSAGLKGVFSINSVIVPVMIVFIIAVSSTVINDSIKNIQHTIPTEHWNYKWITNPLTYTALNIILAQSVLVPLASSINDVKVIKLGGILGGLGLTTMLVLSHLTIISIPYFYEYHIPMAEAVKEVNPFFHLFFVIVIIGEIITTVIGNVFGMSRQLHSILNIKPYTFVILLLTICYIVSYVHYSPLLGILYPLIGWISFIFLPLIAMNTLKKRLGHK